MTPLNLTRSAPPSNRISRAAAAIHAAHEHWIRGFEEITRRARDRFERRDWRGAQADATARLALYRIHLDGAVADVRDILEDSVLERTLWAAVKTRHFEGLPAGPTPKSRRRSSTRSPAGSSVPSAPIPPSSISTRHPPPRAPGTRS